MKTYFLFPKLLWQKLFASFEQVEFKRGNYLIKAGDYSSNLFVIESGLIRQYGWSRKGEFTQWIGTANHFVTDLASFISTFLLHGVFNVSVIVICTDYPNQITKRWKMRSLSGTNLNTTPIYCFGLGDESRNAQSYPR
ncbi:hypothetical protein [Sphingobacterium prati]|uniref:hypothetical protein n=1 Tax=Sphingobacterium prati TaxID=2737006 RepID=UPI001554C786|nr:hypothetical protein [Sphingobacterium prati]NPE46549.1 hypothetical protein [Sphingobacterium prati]